MLLGMTIGEVFGVVFGAFITALSLWLLYQWEIRPEREVRRQLAWRAIEEMHRDHWVSIRREARRVNRTNKIADRNQLKTEK